MKIADAWAIYNKKVVRQQHTHGAELAWRNLGPFFGKRDAATTTQDLIDQYVAKRVAGKIGRPVKSQSVTKELAYLLAALRCAGVELPKIKLPRGGAPRDRWLRTEEIQKLLTTAAAMRPDDRLSRGERFLWLALETAARKQALLDLTWDRVDFETNVIFLDVPGRVVTKKRRATVPISKALLPILVRAHRERINERVLDDGGDPWRLVKSIAKKAGVPNVFPHALRHTAATHMARKGVPLWIIGKILGNTLQMVESVYAKHAPEDLRSAVDLISNGALEAAE